MGSGANFTLLLAKIGELNPKFLIQKLKFLIQFPIFAALLSHKGKQ